MSSFLRWPSTTLSSLLLLQTSAYITTSSPLLLASSAATLAYSLYYYASASLPPTLVLPTLPPSPTHRMRAMTASLSPSSVPSAYEAYSPPPLIDNGHLMTLVAARARPSVSLRYTRESLFLSDGGMVALDWATPGLDIPPHVPVVLVLHGLTGGSDESYVKSAVSQLIGSGFAPVVFNYRGAAGTDVLTPRGYSASATDDLEAVVEHIRGVRAKNNPLMAIGFSLGANILVSHLARAGQNTQIDAAVAACCPFTMLREKEHALPGIYERVFTKNLVRFAKSHPLLAAHPEINIDDLDKCATVRDFDQAVTIKVFDHPTVDAYYEHASVSQRLHSIAIPTLFLSAHDDPIVPGDLIPRQAIAENPNLAAIVTARGGHCAWLEARDVFGSSWADRVADQWFSSILDQLTTTRTSK